jgi:DNA replication protein DnaC
MREILQKENFSHFSFDYYSDTIRDEVTGYSARESAHDAVMKARHFIDSFGKEFQNLFLHGNTGVGKTFLTNCIAKELIDRANCVIYFSAFDLFQTLAQNTFQKDTSIENIQEDILNCDLLIIDDLGTETVNNFTVSQLFLCLNHRHENKKSTIISTNLPVEAIQDICSERISSRIISYYNIFLIFGEDIRIRIARSRY